MRRLTIISLCIICVVAASSVFAQRPGLEFTMKHEYLKVATADDSAFFAIIAKVKEKGIDTLPIGKRVAEIGKMFLGIP